MNVTTMDDGGAVAGKLECDEPMVGSDVQHARTLGVTEKIAQSRNAILIHADHAGAALAYGAVRTLIH
jgi:hypothetical protein